jgi:DNA-directed RNA polymerase specialized sigma24 family protein
VGSQEFFERYLAASIAEEDPESLLETLLVECAPPILNRVVRSRMGSLYTPHDAADLAGEATVELLGRLRAFRETASPPQIPFDALAAGIAANTVHRFFARRFPERNRLRKRLRYAIETDGRLRLWAGADGAAICGLAGGPGATAGETQPLADAAAVERCANEMRRPIPGDRLASLVLQILRTLARPLELSRLTGLVAEISGGLREPSWISPAAYREEETPGMPPDPAPSAAARLELRQRLERLWPEIVGLAARHRSALLLSARGPSGAAVWLLVDLGVASFGEVARVLEMTPEELAELWNRLPLEDLEIAARMGLERQQVINLRSTARERLARRDQAGRGSIGPITKVIRG